MISVAAQHPRAGKLVTIKGTVVRVSRVKPLITRMQFACGKCGEAFGMGLADGKFEIPSKCSTPGCRGKSFTPMHATAIATDWQKVGPIFSRTPSRKYKSRATDDETDRN
jgi:DNA replicative helicase MCM subunit Mcm2 (Cdc46/Mcm family)